MDATREQGCRTRMLAAFDLIVDAVDDAAWELGRLNDERELDDLDDEALQRGVHAARAVVRDGEDGPATPAELLAAAASAWESADANSAWPALLHGFAQGLGDAADEPAAFAGFDAAVRAAHDALRNADASEALSEAVIGFADDFAARRSDEDVVGAWGHAVGVAEETAQESAAGSDGLPEPNAVAFAIIVGAVFDAINT